MLTGDPVQHAWSAVVIPSLPKADLCALAFCNKWFLNEAREEMCRRGIVTWASGTVVKQLTKPAYRDLQSLRLRDSWFNKTPALPRLQFPRLRRIELLSCNYGHDPAMFRHLLDACPALETVKIKYRITARNCVVAVNHIMDLVEFGAPRLLGLDVAGGYWRMVEANPGMEEARERNKSLCVSSDVLQCLAWECGQVTPRVDAPLHTLVLKEERERDPTSLYSLGPAVHEHLAHLDWTCYTMGAVDALARFSALQSVNIQVLYPVPQREMDRLRHLPPGVREVRIAFGNDDEVEGWPAPLAHLTGLEKLHIDTSNRISGVEELAGSWLGAGPSCRYVEFRWMVGCRNERDRARWQLEGTRLAAWLDNHPRATACLMGCVVQTAHHRLHTPVTPSAYEHLQAALKVTATHAHATEKAAATCARDHGQEQGDGDADA